MREITRALEARMDDTDNPTPALGPAGLGPPDFEWLAKRWASYCIENLAGDSLDAGLRLAGALVTFSRCDAALVPDPAQ